MEKGLLGWKDPPKKEGGVSDQKGGTENMYWASEGEVALLYPFVHGILGGKCWLRECRMCGSQHHFQ